MLPYILAAVGGYLIGDSMKKQYARGGMMADGGKIDMDSTKKDWDNWDRIFGRMATLEKAGYSEKEAKKLSKNNWNSLDKQVQKEVIDAIVSEEIESMKGMMESLYTYGGLDKDDSYLEKYKTRLGKDVFNKTFNSYKKELEKFEVVRDVHTDSEGLSYNSLKLKKGKQYADGGMMVKRERSVWNKWTRKQRLHFLSDHKDELSGYVDVVDFDLISKSNYDKLIDLDYDNGIVNSIDVYVNVNDVLSKHIKEGQYADGGMMAKGGMTQ